MNSLNSLMYALLGTYINVNEELEFRVKKHHIINVRAAVFTAWFACTPEQLKGD